MEDVRYFLDKYEKTNNIKDLFNAKMMLNSLIIYKKLGR